MKNWHCIVFESDNDVDNKVEIDGRKIYFIYLICFMKKIANKAPISCLLRLNETS